MWADLQRQFAAGLFERECAPPEGVRSAPEHFGVHRDNFAVGLSRALAIRYPATERLVGEAFFSAMAREFVRLHPPKSPVLLEYGETFAAFVETFEPTRELLPYLPDIVRLEDARVRAYHAADAPPLALRELAAIPIEDLAELTFVIHPAAAVLRSRHPIVTIWSINVDETPIAPIEDWSGEDALVTRPELRVETHRLCPGGAIFVESLMGGAAFGVAARAAAQETQNFDLSAILVEILTAGVLAAIRGR